MANISKANLQDKDIRNLTILPKQYIRSVGNPKELYIWVNPSGIKTFSLRYERKYIKIKEFCEGIYSVAEARKDALKMLKELEGGKDILTIKGKNEKYLFKNLISIFIDQQRLKCTKDYVDKMQRAVDRYLIPSLGQRDVKDIKNSDLLEIITPIFRPENITESRLDLIDRLCNYLKRTFEIAIDDDYIIKNPAKNLRKNFPTKHNFYKANGHDPRLLGLFEHNDIKEWIIDFKNNTKMQDDTRRMILLLILSANRPFNIVSAKWKYIDFEKSLWQIPAVDMKMGIAHTIPLTQAMIKILKAQQVFSANNEYIFPFDTHKKANSDALRIKLNYRVATLEKAVRCVCGDKWKGKLVAHGWRKTFKTLCSKNSAELLQNGISNDVVEDCLAHKNTNKVEYSYELERATIEQKRTLMQWYGDYLNNIESLGI